MRKRPVKKFSLHMKKTLVAVMLIITVLFIGLLVRVFTIIEKDSDRYKKRVLSQQTYVSNDILYKRGEIRDRNGTVLAVSVKVYDLIISPKDILKDSKNGEFTLQTLVNCFGLNYAELSSLVNSNPESQYKVIQDKKGLTDEEIKPFEDAKTAAKEAAAEAKNDEEKPPQIAGVWFEERYARKYPLSEVGAHIIGFVDGEYGTNGIENCYNKELTGSYGREYGYFDAELNLQRTIKPAVDGNNIISTIDANVQRIVENLIKNKMQSLGAKHIAVMVMDPNNGEILAMASEKTYDLNNPRSLKGFYSEDEINAMSEKNKVDAYNEIWANFCTSYTYEPGSTFKPFIVAAALDEGTTTPNTVYTCNGIMQVSDYQIGCANRIVHEAVTPKKAVMESCNVALMQIAAGLGRTQFYRYMNLFGFGNKTGIDLDREERGIIHAESGLNTVELATSSFGQTQNVTMVQMLSAFSSIINGGKYYAPHVVKEITNAQNATVKKNKGEIVRHTISEHTSELMRDYLKATVSDGTATPAQVAGYSIGGKTGTAEKHGVDVENDYIVSFIGCAPANNPKVSIYVIIDEPAVEDQAHSTYATEFASKIMEKILPFLSVYPDANAVTPETAAPETETTETTPETETSETVAPESEASETVPETDGTALE